MSDKAESKARSIDRAAEPIGDGRTLTALAIAYTAAATSAYVLPVIAGAVGEGLGFRVEDLGYLLAVELAAITIGAFAIFPRLEPQRLGLWLSVSMIVIIATNLLSAWVTKGSAYLVLRGGAGLGEGVAQACVLAAGARLADPERAFTRIYTVLTFVLAAVFIGLPGMMTQWGYPSALVLLALFGAAGLMFAPLSRRSATVQSAAAGPAVAWDRGHAFVLCAWLMFVIGQYAIFVYAERIADDAGISFEHVAFIFAAASVATIPAPWFAGWSIRRWGLAVPVAASVLLSTASIVAFPLVRDEWQFGLVFLLFNCAMFYAFPLVSTLGARIDPGGRVPSLLPAMQAVGMVIGPIVASATLGAVHSYFALGLVAGLLSSAALVAIWPAARADRRSSVAPATDVAAARH